MLLQIPGGPELIVVLLIAILLFGIPLLLIAVVGALYLRAEDGGDDDVAERVADLEAEIAALRAEIAGDDAPVDATTSGGETTVGDSDSDAIGDDGHDEW
jgi:sec-independent protein translocase protein TatA